MRQALSLLLLVFLPLPALAQVRSTIAVPNLNVQNDQASPTGPDAVYCRPPQQLPGQRLYWPKVCKPQREWDDIHRQGLDIAADGQGTVVSEKYRTFHGCASAAAC
jgi:hypothetical protein